MVEPPARAVCADRRTRADGIPWPVFGDVASAGEGFHHDAEPSPMHRG